MNVFDITQNRLYTVILRVTSIMYILRIVYLHSKVDIVDYMILLTITIDIAYSILYLRYRFIDISVCTVLYAILKSFVTCFWLYYADTWFERSTKEWKWFPSENSYVPWKGTTLNRKILYLAKHSFSGGPSWIFKENETQKVLKISVGQILASKSFCHFGSMKNPSEKKNPLERIREKPPVEDDPTGCIGCGLETPEVSRRTWEGAAQQLRGPSRWREK